MPLSFSHADAGPSPRGMRDRVRRSRRGAPLVVGWRAVRGAPLAVDGDTPEVQQAAKRATAWVYNRLSHWLDRSNTDFMNYGFWPATEAATPGEGDDVCQNLYRRVAGAVDLRDKDVLEVGSGRGGGAALVARDLHARTMVGIDLSPGAVAHCRATHHEPNLRFYEADAEDLPFVAGSFDAVVNVESSHGYPSMRRFLDEVHRVLREGGTFLFADVRHPSEIDELHARLRDAGFAIVEEERLTDGVARALELDNPRRERIVASVPRPLRGFARSFVGAEGGVIYTTLRNGELEYLRFVLRREAAPDAELGRTS